MPLLHLPVQSGSDRILAAMNRRHTRADYLAIIARARAARPDIAFTSDFIVGFPGESEDDFQATLALVDEVGYSSAYTFKYSARPGTPAADLPDQVPEDVKSERLRRLQQAIDRQYAAFRAQCVGPDPRRAVRAQRPLSWPTRRPLPISSAGAGHGAVIDDRRDCPGANHRGQRQQPVRRPDGRRRPDADRRTGGAEAGA